MAYYVRKIARAKWSLLDQSSENNIENYKADAIANDMRTQGNTLSLWRVESLDEKDTEPVVVINSLLGDTFSKIDLIFIPEDMMSEFALENTDGNTVVSNYSNLHYDVISLTVKKHILFAKNVILKIFKLEEARFGSGATGEQAPLIKRFSEETQLTMVEQWIQNGEIEFEALTEHQKQGFLKWKEKKNRAS